MRIVLKPLGAAAVLGAIGVLAFLAFQKGPAKNTGNPAAAGSAPIHAGVHPAGTEPLTVYKNGLENGWQERGWAKVLDFKSASRVHGSGGGIAIRVEAAAFEAVKIWNPTADLSGCTHLVFFVNGGKDGGQQLAVATVASGKTQKSVALAPLPADKWVRVVIPMSELDVQGRRDVNAFWVQNTQNKTAVFHVDDIQFRLTPPENSPEETLGRLQAAVSP